MNKTSGLPLAIEGVEATGLDLMTKFQRAEIGEGKHNLPKTRECPLVET